MLFMQSVPDLYFKCCENGIYIHYITLFKRQKNLKVYFVTLDPCSETFCLLHGHVDKGYPFILPQMKIGDNDWIRPVIW